MNGFKTEQDVKMEDGGSGYMDDEFYEDTGELAIPKNREPKDIWVTRIPKWLHEAVSNIDNLTDGRDDDVIIIGEVLAKFDPQRPGRLSKEDSMRMFINTPGFKNKKLPQAFDLNMTTATQDVLNNTYVFTEKDLPGYKPTSSFGGRMAQRPKQELLDPNAKVQKRSKYRKAIPKQTSLIGAATREYNATPLPTKEFIDFNQQRIRTAIQGRSSQVNLLDDIKDPHSMTIGRKDAFKDFVKPKAPPRTQLNKAARIAPNDLVDLLHECFDQYAYWPMRALKARTKQPEAYLKEHLQRIAVLVKSGPYASTWKRQSLFENVGRDLSNQIQQAAVVNEADVDDDDEGEEEMEDVL